jgi:3-oxoacyl-[acyl-carrier-protein] synthase-3
MMEEDQVNIGIVSYGLCLPDSFETAEEVSVRAGIAVGEVRKLGIERKCRPAKDDQPVAMAVKAAQQAFAGTEEVRPEEVDVVIWTGEEYKDYVAQTPSIRLQEEVGCSRAWAFDLVGQNVTSIQGIKLARDLISGDETINKVLLAGGTRNVDLVNYANRETHFLLASSASGGALLLKRQHHRNRLITTAFRVDCEMSDEVYVPGGGTEIPFSADNLDSEIMFYQVQHPAMVQHYLEQRWTGALSETARKALSGHSPDYVALRHLSPLERSAVLNGLGVSAERSAALEKWGCHGTNDIILSLDLGLQTGAIQDGFNVVLVTGGIGFTYAAALIRWGGC